MGTTTTPNLGLIKPDGNEPGLNFPAQHAANMDKLDSLVAPVKGTYAPVITGSTNPVINGTSFLDGKWWRNGLFVTFSIDLFIDEAADFGGSSWRISLPFGWDSAFHTGGVLSPDKADAVGNFFVRSDTSTDSSAGVCLLDSGGNLIFYRHGSNTSIGGGLFTTTARLKAFGQYVAASV